MYESGMWKCIKMYESGIWKSMNQGSKGMWKMYESGVKKNVNVYEILCMNQRSNKLCEKYGYKLNYIAAWKYKYEY